MRDMHVGNGPCEFSYSTHVLQIFIFHICTYIVCIVLYKGMNGTKISHQTK